MQRPAKMSGRRDFRPRRSGAGRCSLQFGDVGCVPVKHGAEPVLHRSTYGVDQHARTTIELLQLSANALPPQGFRMDLVVRLVRECVGHGREVGFRQQGDGRGRPADPGKSAVTAAGAQRVAGVQQVLGGQHP